MRWFFFPFGQKSTYSGNVDIRVEKRSASDLSKAVGAVIVGRHKKKGLNQAQLAAAIGISPTTMQRLLSGKAEFDVDQLGKIADALQTTAVSIIQEAEKDLAEARMSEGHADNVVSFPSRPDTVEELESYAGPKAAHSRDEESDQPEQ